MGSFAQFLRFLFFVSVSYLSSVIFELKIDVLLSQMHTMSVNLVHDYICLITSLKIDVYKLNYWWYARPQYYILSARKSA